MIRTTKTIPQKYAWIMRSPRLSEEQKMQLLDRARSGDRIAADKLIHSLSTAIFREVQKHAPPGDIDELFSEALLAVYTCLAKHDSSRGGNILTVALFAAKGAIAHVLRKGYAKKRVGFEVSVDGAEDRNKDQEHRGRREESQLWKEIIEDIGLTPAEEALINAQDTKNLIDVTRWKAFKNCSAEVREVIRLMYIDNDLTEAEIANKKGVSREAIRQLKLKGLTEIRMVLDLPLPSDLPTAWYQRKRYADYQAAWLKSHPNHPKADP